MNNVRMNESAENIGFIECRIKGRPEKFVLQLTYPQCFFQVHEFRNTQEYMDTLAKSTNWVHTQVGCRTMALTFNGCMMHYDYDQTNASERAKQLIETLKEAAKWYNDFLAE